MDDLRVPAGPGIPLGILIPARELFEQFSHASGPGGQGVNTADSRVQLTFDVGATTALTDEQRARIITRLSSRLTGTAISIDAAETRSQLRNRVAARERLATLLRDALAPEIIRRATKPTRGSQRRRIVAKKTRSETKRNRQRPAHD